MHGGRSSRGEWHAPWHRRAAVASVHDLSGSEGPLLLLKGEASPPHTVVFGSGRGAGVAHAGCPGRRPDDQPARMPASLVSTSAALLLPTFLISTYPPHTPSDKLRRVSAHNAADGSFCPHGRYCRHGCVAPLHPGGGIDAPLRKFRPGPFNRLREFLGSSERTDRLCQGSP